MDRHKPPTAVNIPDERADKDGEEDKIAEEVKAL
jgi:hypothetical protein